MVAVFAVTNNSVLHPCTWTAVTGARAANINDNWIASEGLCCPPFINSTKSGYIIIFLPQFLCYVCIPVTLMVSSCFKIPDPCGFFRCHSPNPICPTFDWKMTVFSVSPGHYSRKAGKTIVTKVKMSTFQSDISIRHHAVQLVILKCRFLRRNSYLSFAKYIYGIIQFLRNVISDTCNLF